MKSQLDKLLNLLNIYTHEIRTPLNSVVGFLEFLKSEGCKGTFKQEYLDLMNIAANRTLNNFNEFALIAFSLNPHQTKVKEMVCLEDTFQEVEKILNADYWLNFEKRTYIFKIDADKHVSINADLDLLRLAFLWFFCEVYSFRGYKEKECTFFINIGCKFDEVRIILSNLTDDKDQQRITMDITNNVFVEFVLETISNNSGTIETKLDADGKPFVIITFPRT